MDSHRLRAIILNLQDRLSNDDRKRLHFYLGNDVPRRIRDDPSLGGTLSLMDCLFDQDKINEYDFTLLINALDDIRCIDAVKLLREHLKRNQAKGLNQSMESLSMIMPPILDQLLQDEDEDKHTAEHSFLNQQTIRGDNNVMINSNNTNINQIPMIICDQKTTCARSQRKHILKSTAMLWKCLLIFVLLLILGYVVLLVLFVKNINHIGYLKTWTNKNIIDINQLKTSNNQSIEMIQQLKNDIKQLEKKDHPCSNLGDCRSCLSMVPTCHWCVNAESGHVPRCTVGSASCKTWYGTGVDECPPSNTSNSKQYSCSDLRDCRSCLSMVPTCHWCVRADSGHVPRCTTGSTDCKGWYGGGVHECPSSNTYNPKPYPCSDLPDCRSCLSMVPTCNWCVRADSGHVPRCTTGSMDCKGWYGGGVHECPS